MDTAQWPQEIVVKPIEEIVVTNRCPRPPGVVDHERKARPQKEQALKCPRCNSTNTKFCYYNNYSLTQPRYFCKTCRRYWTEGGSLRNIPVGGGSRKNKRSSSFFNSSSSIIIPPPKNIKLSIIPDDNNNNDNITPSNKVHDEGQDLNLSFPNISELLVQQNNNNTIVSASSASSSSSTTTTTTSSHHHHNFSSALELITGITTTTTATTTFMPSTHDDTNIGYTNFPLLLRHHHDLIKPSNSLNFSLDGGSAEIGFGSLIQDHTTSGGGHGGRILFPFQDLKHDSTTTATTILDHQNNNNNKEQPQEDHSTGGYWTGMLGGGGSW